jgi:anaerobic selenocysteine-containing dehydrogenase/Fe-S-cluster-containing dehydrogenase component
MVATAGAGFAAGCDTRKAEKLIPYLAQPPEIVTGEARYFATTCRECPAGCGMLVRTREGRAVKLEGNPDDPLTGGALCARGQAALQGLYNPDRPVKPLLRDEAGKLCEATWEEALERIKTGLSAALSAGRPGTIAFLTGETSDSDAELIEQFAGVLGIRRLVNLRLFTEAPQARAAESLFGITAAPEYHPEKADLLISFGADFAETWGNPVALTAGFTDMHGYRNGAKGRAVYVGPRQSNTASICDEWIRLLPGREAAALRVIADELLTNPIWVDTGTATHVKDLLAIMPVTQAETAVGGAAKRLRELGRELVKAAAPLVIASGLGADAATAHSLAMLVIWLAGGHGTTFTFKSPARRVRGSSINSVADMLDAAENGSVDVLMIHNANPAFLMPSKTEALEKARFIACFTTQFDETAALADLVIPINHPLESWGFHAPSASRFGVIQPAMKPIFGTREFGDILIELAASLPGRGGRTIPWANTRSFVEARLEEMHKEEKTEGTPHDLRELKRRGGLNRVTESIAATLKADAVIPDAVHFANGGGVGTHALFFPHPYLYDGRGADKPWLQEVPETSTSAAWSSWAELHPDTATSLGIARGDALKLSREGGEITVPVLITAQVMPGVVAVPIGQGHEELGRWAKGCGANPLKLTGTGATLAGLAVTLKAVKGGGAPILAAGSQFQGSRGLARAVAIAEAGREQDDHRYDQSLYPEHEHPIYDWTMVIDLDACVGCGACSVACYAENSIGITGAQGLATGREMAWIRIEKYADGDDVRFLPVLCQHCHHAPCEPVCPVNAAYHTDEGTNAQIYNRCVGTRYCSNNCPYKVRRFNFFDYKFPPPLHLQLNPDITVRERGVMEKCTFCLQRIKDAKEAAKNEGRKVADGEVLPACAQTCPAGAITFGNLKDVESRVSTLSRDPRAYRLLEELGTRPSVFYLKKVLRGEGGEA